MLLLPLALALYLPLWAMLIASLSSSKSSLNFSYLLPDLSKFTFNNFILVWRDGNFSRYFLNSAIVTFCITVGNIIFDSMVAYAFARREFPFKKTLWLLIAVKLMIPAAVLLVPTFSLARYLNIYDSYFALILPFLTETFGIYVITQYIKNIPYSFEEAAIIEGATDIAIFIKIVFPLLKPALVIVALHSILTSWNMYIFPLILTSSDSLRTLPLGINFYSLSHPEASTAELMATNIITALPVFLLFLVYQNKLISNLTQGALKG